MTEEGLLSIGEVAERTGLGVLRIRAWEQRHGLPSSVRTAAGHRRYTIEECLRLELVSHAIGLGHKIGELSNLSLVQLRGLVSTSKPGSEHGGAAEAEQGSWDPTQEEQDGQRLELFRWIRLADEGKVRRWLEADLHTGDWMDWVEAKVIPSIIWIGDGWKRGELTVAEEHFFTGVLQNLLEENWRSLNRSLTGSPMVLAVLTGESHCLGLQLCALAATKANVPVVWLGTSTPMASVLGAAQGWKARGICISISCTCPWSVAKEQLEFLAAQRPKGVQLFVGGKGYRDTVKGFKSFSTLRKFHAHIAA